LILQLTRQWPHALRAEDILPRKMFAEADFGASPSGFCLYNVRWLCKIPKKELREDDGFI